MQSKPSAYKRVPLDRNYAVTRTKELLLRGPQNGRDCLVQPPPTVLSARLLPELIAKEDLFATIFVPTDAEKYRLQSECENQGLSVNILASKYGFCKSYNGDEGDAVEEKIKNALEYTSLGKLHQTGALACQPSCPFESNQQSSLGKADVLIGTPSFAYIDDVCDDRVVFISSIRDDYIEKIRDPVKALGGYLNRETPFSGYEDFIRTRNQDDTAFSSIESLAKAMSRKEIQPNKIDKKNGYDVNKADHPLAPLVFFGLLQAMELDNGWETTYHHREEYGISIPTNRGMSPSPDPFDIAGVDYSRQRIVRQPGDEPEEDTIYVARIPDLSGAKSIVAFDIAPTKWMWDFFYGTNFEHERVYSPTDTAAFLGEEMDATVIQTADSRKPYDGSNPTPGRDASIALWTMAVHGKYPHLISTKNAITGKYRSKNPDLLDTDTRRVIRYRRGDRMIAQNAPVVNVNGSPRPSTTELQMWGAFQGKAVPDETDRNQSLGRIGDEIRHQFAESRVAKWATRFESRGGTIVLNTSAIPDWLDDSRFVTYMNPTDVLPDNAFEVHNVIRYIKEQSTNDQWVTVDDMESGADVSENTALKTKDILLEEGWFVKHSTGVRQPTKYEWDP